MYCVRRLIIIVFLFNISFTQVPYHAFLCGVLEFRLCRNMLDSHPERSEGSFFSSMMRSFASRRMTKKVIMTQSEFGLACSSLFDTQAQHAQSLKDGHDDDQEKRIQEKLIQLEKQLETGNETLIPHIFLQLQKIGLPAASVLIHALHHKKEDMRRYARNVLEKLGPSLIPYLVEDIKQAKVSETFLEDVGYLLGKQKEKGAEQAVPVIIKIIEQYKENYDQYEVCKAALKLLGNIVRPQQEQYFRNAVDTMLLVLKPKPWWCIWWMKLRGFWTYRSYYFGYCSIQNEALRALSSLGIECVPLLLQYRRTHQDPLLRELSSEALIWIAPVLRQDQFSMQAELNDPDWLVRYCAVSVLAHIKKYDGAMIAGIKKALKDRSAHVRLAALIAYTQHPEYAHEVLPLVMKLTQDSAVAIRKTAIEVLRVSHCEDPRAVEVLIQCLKDKEVCNDAVKALGELKESAHLAASSLYLLANEYIQGGVVQTDYHVSAISALGDIAVQMLKKAESTSEEKIRKRLNKDIHRIVELLIYSLERACAVKQASDALVLIGEPAIGPLREMLKTNYHSYAEDILGKMAPLVLPLLLDDIKKEHFFEQQNAVNIINTLAAMGPLAGEAIEYLKKVPYAPDSYLWQQTIEAIGKVGAHNENVVTFLLDLAKEQYKTSEHIDRSLERALKQSNPMLLMKYGQQQKEGEDICYIIVTVLYKFFVQQYNELPYFTFIPKVNRGKEYSPLLRYALLEAQKHFYSRSLCPDFWKIGLKILENMGKDAVPELQQLLEVKNLPKGMHARIEELLVKIDPLPSVKMILTKLTSLSDPNEKKRYETMLFCAVPAEIQASDAFRQVVKQYMRDTQDLAWMSPFLTPPGEFQGFVLAEVVQEVFIEYCSEIRQAFARVIDAGTKDTIIHMSIELFDELRDALSISKKGPSDIISMRELVRFNVFLCKYYAELFKSRKDLNNVYQLFIAVTAFVYGGIIKNEAMVEEAIEHCLLKHPQFFCHVCDAFEKRQLQEQIRHIWRTASFKDIVEQRELPLVPARDPSLAETITTLRRAAELNNTAILFEEEQDSLDTVTQALDKVRTDNDEVFWIWTHRGNKANELFKMYIPDASGNLVECKGLLKTLKQRAQELAQRGGKIYVCVRTIDQYDPKARVGLNPVVWERYLGVDEQGNQEFLPDNVQFVFIKDMDSPINDASFYDRFIRHRVPSVTNGGLCARLASLTGLAEQDPFIQTLEKLYTKFSIHSNTKFCDARFRMTAKDIESLAIWCTKIPSAKSAWQNEIAMYMRARLFYENDYEAFLKEYMAILGLGEMPLAWQEGLGEFKWTEAQGKVCLDLGNGLIMPASERLLAYHQAHQDKTLEEALCDVYEIILSDRDRSVLHTIALSLATGDRRVGSFILEGFSGEGKTFLIESFPLWMGYGHYGLTVSEDMTLAPVRGAIALQSANGEMHFSFSENTDFFRAVQDKKSGIGHFSESNTNEVYLTFPGPIIRGEQEVGSFPEFARLPGQGVVLQKHISGSWVWVFDLNPASFGGGREDLPGWLVNNTRILKLGNEYQTEKGFQKALETNLKITSRIAGYYQLAEYLTPAQCEEMVGFLALFFSELMRKVRGEDLLLGQTITRRELRRTLDRLVKLLKSNQEGKRNQDPWALLEKAVAENMICGWKSNEVCEKVRALAAEKSKKRIGTSHMPTGRDIVYQVLSFFDRHLLLYSGPEENTYREVKHILEKQGVQVHPLFASALWDQTTALGGIVPDQEGKPVWGLGIFSQRMIEARTKPQEHHAMLVKGFEHINSRFGVLLNKALQDGYFEIERSTIPQEAIDRFFAYLDQQADIAGLLREQYSKEHQARAPDLESPEGRWQFFFWAHFSFPENLKVIVLAERDQELTVSEAELSRYTNINLSYPHWISSPAAASYPDLDDKEKKTRLEASWQTPQKDLLVPTKKLKDVETWLADTFYGPHASRVARLEGGPGGGKSDMAVDFAKRIGQDHHVYNFHFDIDTRPFLGGITITKEGNRLVLTGERSAHRDLLPFLRLFSKGGIGVCDEGEMGENARDVIALLVMLATDAEEIVLSDYFPQDGYMCRQERVFKKHNNFRLIITNNNAKDTHGRVDACSCVTKNAPVKTVSHLLEKEDAQMMVGFWAPILARQHPQLVEELIAWHQKMEQKLGEYKGIVISPRELIRVARHMEKVLAIPGRMADKGQLHELIDLYYLEKAFPQHVHAQKEELRTELLGQKRLSFDRKLTLAKEGGECVLLVYHQGTDPLIRTREWAKAFAAQKDKGAVCDVVYCHEKMPAQEFMSTQGCIYEGQLSPEGLLYSREGYPLHTKDGWILATIRKAAQDTEHEYVRYVHNISEVREEERTLLNQTLLQKKISVPQQGGSQEHVYPDNMSVVMSAPIEAVFPKITEEEAVSGPFRDRFLELEYTLADELISVEGIRAQYPFLTQQEAQIIIEQWKRLVQIDEEGKLSMRYGIGLPVLEWMCEETGRIMKNWGTREVAAPFEAVNEAVVWVTKALFKSEDYTHVVDKENPLCAQVESKIDKQIAGGLGSRVEVPDEVSLGERETAILNCAIRIVRQEGSVIVTTPGNEYVIPEKILRIQHAVVLSKGLRIECEDKGTGFHITLVRCLVDKVLDIAIDYNNGFADSTRALPPEETPMSCYSVYAGNLLFTFRNLLASWMEVENAEGIRHSVAVSLMGVTGTMKTTLIRNLSYLLGVDLFMQTGRVDVEPKEVSVGLWADTAHERMKLEVKELLAQVGLVNGKRLSSCRAKRRIILADEANACAKTWEVVRGVLRGEPFRIMVDGELFNIVPDKDIMFLFTFNPVDDGQYDGRGDMWLLAQEARPVTMANPVDEPKKIKTEILDGIYARNILKADQIGKRDATLRTSVVFPDYAAQKGYSQPSLVLEAGTRHQYQQQVDLFIEKKRKEEELQNEMFLQESMREQAQQKSEARESSEAEESDNVSSYYQTHEKQTDTKMRKGKEVIEDSPVREQNVSLVKEPIFEGLSDYHVKINVYTTVTSAREMRFPPVLSEDLTRLNTKHVKGAESYTGCVPLEGNRMRLPSIGMPQAVTGYRVLSKDKQVTFEKVLVSFFIDPEGCLYAECLDIPPGAYYLEFTLEVSRKYMQGPSKEMKPKHVRQAQGISTQDVEYVTSLLEDLMHDTHYSTIQYKNPNTNGVEERPLAISLAQARKNPLAVLRDVALFFREFRNEENGIEKYATRHDSLLAKIVSARSGVCRQRCDAALIILKALGFCVREVESIDHVFLEVLYEDGNWYMLDLGGGWDPATISRSGQKGKNPQSAFNEEHGEHAKKEMKKAFDRMKEVEKVRQKVKKRKENKRQHAERTKKTTKSRQDHESQKHESQEGSDGEQPDDQTSAQGEEGQGESYGNQDEELSQSEGIVRSPMEVDDTSPFQEMVRPWRQKYFSVIYRMARFYVIKQTQRRYYTDEGQIVDGNRLAQAKHTHDPNVFLNTVMHKRDKKASIGFTVDQSGSMGEIIQKLACAVRFGTWILYEFAHLNQKLSYTVGAIRTDYEPLLECIRGNMKKKQDPSDEDLYQALGKIEQSDGVGIHMLNYLRAVIKKYESYPELLRAEHGQRPRIIEIAWTDGQDISEATNDPEFKELLAKAEEMGICIIGIGLNAPDIDLFPRFMNLSESEIREEVFVHIIERITTYPGDLLRLKGDIRMPLHCAASELGQCGYRGELTREQYHELGGKLERVMREFPGGYQVMYDRNACPDTGRLDMHDTLLNTLMQKLILKIALVAPSHHEIDRVVLVDDGVCSDQFSFSGYYHVATKTLFLPLSTALGMYLCAQEDASLFVLFLDDFCTHEVHEALSGIHNDTVYVQRISSLPQELSSLKKLVQAV